MDSLDKFDPEKTVRFKTYAEYRIKGAIGDELRSQDCVSRSSRLKAKRLKNSVERLQKENGRQVKDEELAEELGITLEAYYELANEVNEISSPDFEKSGERRSSSEGMLDFSPGKLKENPYYTVSQVELMNLTTRAIENLPSQERMVICLYYYQELTLKEIGEVMSFTESTICQIHSKALSKVNPRIADDFYRPGKV